MTADDREHSGGFLLANTTVLNRKSNFLLVLSLLTVEALSLVRFSVCLDPAIPTVLRAQGHIVLRWENLSNECLEMHEKWIMSGNSAQDPVAS